MSPDASNASDKPTDVELWNRLGEIALASGHAEIAGDCFRAASALSPLPPVISIEKIHAAGIRFLNEGKLLEAERELRLALRLNPGIAAFHDHLGVVLAGQKRFAEAEASFRLATRLDPTSLSAWKNLTRSNFDLRRFANVEAAAVQALRIMPGEADLTLQLVIALGEQSKFAEAEAKVKEINDPNLVHRLHFALGAVYGTLGNYAEAERCFREVIRIEPHSALAYSNLAAALGKKDRWAEAAEAGRRAVELDPTNATAWGNLGNALRDLGRLDEAEQAIRTSLARDPAVGDPMGNLALVHAMRGQVREAIALYDQAIRLKPNSPEMRFNRAVALLSLGEFRDGWNEYEWRTKTDQQKNDQIRFSSPVWDGVQSLLGKTILVYTEQGAGDAIQFIRLTEELTRLGAKTHVATRPELVSLLRTCPGVASLGLLNDPVRHDIHCSVMSLPRLLRIGSDRPLPNRTPYLTADKELVEKWRNRLSGITGLKVGIVWQGNPKHIGDRWRSVLLSRFHSLAEVPGTRLISLQKDPGTDQIATCAFPIIELGSELEDFSDTAGLIMNLDLIVGVDTAVVHLAGALGKPVWILLPLNADWRWLTEREDSPWYPTARLLRQKTFGDWGPVFTRAAVELGNRTF